MLSFLFFIIIFVLLIGLLLLSTVFGFIRSILGLGRQAGKTGDSKPTDVKKKGSGSKVFKKTDGEYVDFEEVE